MTQKGSSLEMKNYSETMKQMGSGLDSVMSWGTEKETHCLMDLGLGSVRNWGSATLKGLDSDSDCLMARVRQTDLG